MGEDKRTEDTMERQRSTRAGTYVRQLEGYRAFLPTPLPPVPPLEPDSAVYRLLSDADRALGRLDGAASILPNPDFFVSMYVRQEAVLSSQIEGTQSTLKDLLLFESQHTSNPRSDVDEIVHYVDAMGHGLERLKTLPLSLRLLREVHERLLATGRGSEKQPGEFRRSQNWIGTPGCTLAFATFVPPPPHELMRCLGELEAFMHAQNMPPLLQVALLHAQFETIHPFLDGNGRIGRLLITLFLCERGILHRPLLYLSVYLKRHRQQYYDRLMAIRHDGDWEGWVSFFLQGVIEVSQHANDTAQRILHLREELRARETSGVGQRMIDLLFETPVVNIPQIADALSIAYNTAASTVETFLAEGDLVEITGQKRNRVYRFERYLTLFEG